MTWRDAGEMQHDPRLDQQVKPPRGLAVGIGLRLHEAEGPAVDLQGRPERCLRGFLAHEAGLRRGRAGRGMGYPVSISMCPILIVPLSYDVSNGSGKSMICPPQHG